MAFNDVRAKGWVTVGLIYRGQVRRYLAKQNVTFTEQKSLVDSQFVYEGYIDDVMEINDTFRDFQRRLNER